MKKFFLGIALVLMLAIVGVTVSAQAQTASFGSGGGGGSTISTTASMTLAELQAMIASLTAQLNAMIASQGGSGGGGGSIINPTATSTGFVSFVERPTLKLVYDKNKSESRLEGSAKVYIQAGSEDILLHNIYLLYKDQSGKNVNTNGAGRYFNVINGAKQEIIQDSNNTTLSVWRIKAGTKALVSITATENPQAIFAGTYTLSFGDIATIDPITKNYQAGRLAYEDTKSLPVTIVGEKSPYISGFEFKSNNVILSGARFSKGDKVYVNGVRKGVLTETDGGAIYATFPISWLPTVNDISKYCYVGGSVQIENSKTGKSNNFWVSKDCDDGSISSVPVSIVNDTVFSSKSDAFIKLSIKGYDTNRKVDHWVLGFNCYYGVTLDSGKFPMHCDGKTTGKNSISFYRNNIYDVTQDYLMITAGALNKSSSAVSLPFNLEARDSNDKTMGRDDLTITLNNSTTQPQAAANQLIKAVLDLAYDSSKAEVALNANQQFSVLAGGEDVYVIWASMKINRVGGEAVIPRGGWIPNGASFAVSGLSNTVSKNFTDTYGNNQTGWLVKAGQKATFIAKSGMNPQLMYSGIYNAEINDVGLYSNGNYGSVVWKGDSMPSNKVTIVGENAVPPTTQPTITKLEAVNTSSGTNSQTSYTINWEASAQVAGVIAISCPGSSGAEYITIGSGSNAQKILCTTSTSQTVIYSADNGSGGGTPISKLSGGAVTLNATLSIYKPFSSQTSSPIATKSINISLNPAQNTPSITVISPNGGETWAQGSQQTIKWQVSNFPLTSSIYIELRPRGNNVNGIVRKIVTVPYLSASGIHTWSISPDITPGQYVIEMYKADSNGNISSTESVKDISDNNFTISPSAPVITIVPVIPLPPAVSATRTCYVGKYLLGKTTWSKVACDSREYLSAPSVLKKEVVITSRAEQISSIAASLQAIKEMLKGLK